ncbi:MAG: MotA/TolQ/ExbB proton channel family protein [Bacteroidaceae bacterium]|nr:MotA/TolQ/ExbB proton channel family protein [Bacteroidaceae bacterium]
MIFLTEVAAEAVKTEVLTKVAEPVQESLNILDLAMKGGWIMIVLAVLSILGIYIFIERFMTLRKAMQKSPHLLARIKDNIRENDAKSAINYCEKLNTPMSRILAKGVKGYRLDTASIRQALDNNAGLEIAALEKGLPILSTIAAVAPMLGFLGTVTGMVQAFWQMSNAGNNIDVSLLSGGIYEAMVTTVGGLVVGIIAIFAYNYLVAQVDKAQNLMEADMIAFIEIVSEEKSGMTDVDNKASADAAQSKE